MKIITISREFGSDGREPGKQLTNVLGFDYCDREIITVIAANQDMDKGYAARTLGHHRWQSAPLTLHHSLAGTAMQSAQIGLLLEQKRGIERIAKTGRDCVSVGRNAAVLLNDYVPFNIFVCADKGAKLYRCMERATEDEHFTSKELARRIQHIAKARAKAREIITSSHWEERKNYHLTVNTTDWDIKELTQSVAEFARRWLGRTEQ